MIDKGKKIGVVLLLWLVATILSASLPIATGHCESLRFVFMADGRGHSLDELINLTALDDIKSQILALSPRPSFVIYGGDSVYRGYSRGEYNFQKFKDAMKSLTDAGIKLYMVMGNHELYREGGSEVDEMVGDFFLDNQLEFQKEFPDNPDNGPPGYERLVYSFESPGGDALFVVGDCYYLPQDEPSADLSGHFDDTQLAWLAHQAAQTKATHKFFFVHAPYYKIDEPQSGQNTTFTHLWNILDKNCFDLFCCGHEHLYSRKTIDRRIAPDPQLSPPVQWINNVTQLLTGTCGAPVATGKPVVDRKAWHVFNKDNTYYFSVVDIHGRNVTVTSYGGQAAPYQVIDHFTIKKHHAKEDHRHGEYNEYPEECQTSENIPIPWHIR